MFAKLGLDVNYRHDGKGSHPTLAERVAQWMLALSVFQESPETPRSVAV